MSEGTDGDLAESVLAGERRQVARAITLVESKRPEDRARADVLLTELWPHAGRSRRIGVSGPPGVGKSTLIDALSVPCLATGRRMGVLAVDPSSSRAGGSLLGDRVRMTRLDQAPDVFVRSSPSGGASGGLSRNARETALILDAAGYDPVMVETVGVGQGEIAVTDVADLLLLVLPAGAGDDVQSMKRGILEHADLIVFSKADGADRDRVLEARDRLAEVSTWMGRGAPVLAVSALEALGIDELWSVLLARLASLESDGVIYERRARQRGSWFRAELERALLQRCLGSEELAASLRQAEAAAQAGAEPPSALVRRLLGLA